MDEALRNLIIGLVLLAIAGAGYAAALLKARASLVGKFQEAELARQVQANAERKALTDMLETYRSEFARERLEREQEKVEREALQAQFDALTQKYAGREREISEFIKQQAADQKRITALEDDKRQRDDQIETLTKRVAALEQERDELAQQVKDRDGELRQRDATISHQQGEIKTLNDKVDALQKRIDDLEKKEKGDTGQLDAVKVPEAAPAEAPAERDTVEQVDTNSKAKE